MLAVNTAEKSDEFGYMRDLFEMLFKINMERADINRNLTSLENVLYEERKEIEKLKKRFWSLSEDVRILEAERDRLIWRASIQRAEKSLEIGLLWMSELDFARCHLADISQQILC